MKKLFEEKEKLLKEVLGKLLNNNFPYYVGGSFLLEYYNTKKINSDFDLDLYVPLKKIKDIDKFNNNKRCIQEVYDQNHNLIYYKYINKETLYIDLFDENNSYGIYIKIYVNAKDYNKYQEILFNKTKLLIPKNLDKYLQDNYGYGYKYLNIEKKSLSSYIIWDSKISYEKYFEELGNNNIVFDKTRFLLLNRKKSLEIPFKKIVNDYKYLIQRTDVRYKLYQKYKDKKDNILMLYKKKDFIKLGMELREYLTEIKKFYDVNLGLSFDKDIFDITIKYLKNDNQKELANWLINNVPKQHLSNLSYEVGKYEDVNKKEYLDNKHLELLIKFNDFCKKHNIIYYAAAGTVLGAIRHNGFIPWDDDIDVVMSYDNYEKFIKAMKIDKIDNTKFVCIENTPNYTISFGRLYDLSSTRIYYTDSLLSSSYGYHLDIFTNDEAIDNHKKEVLIDKLQRLYCELLNPNLKVYEYDYSFYVKISNFIMKIIGRKNFLKIFRKILFNNKKISKDKFKCRWRKKLIFDKNIFEKQLFVPFKNITMPVPIKYEEYLEKLYGESWFLYPKVEDQDPKFRFFNISIPYYIYQEDFLSFTDINKTNKAYRKLKMFDMKKSPLIKETRNIKNKYQFFKEKINKRKEIDLETVNNYFLLNEFGKIFNYLDKYFELQIRNFYLNNNLLFIEDKVFLYNAIFTLIMCGKYYDARKILKCKKVKIILFEYYDALIDLIENNKYISEKNNFEIEKLFNEYPYCIPFFMKYYDILDDDNKKEKILKRFLNIYPSFGEVQYINGLYHLEHNKINEGRKIITDAKNNTRNGLLIKEMNNILNK